MIGGNKIKKKIILIIACAIILSNVFTVSSELGKNKQLSTSNTIMIKNLDPINRYCYDYPVMDIPMSFLEPDVLSPKPEAKETPDQFSWLNYNGKDWTTPAKHQGNCGSCWAFGAIGVLESVIKIKEDSSELNPDLSEQYILSCLPKAGSCHGGSCSRALELIKETTPDGNNKNGVIPESCFQYYADDKIPCSEKCGDWEEKLVPLLDFTTWKSDGSASDIQRIKTDIMEKGPVAAHIMATEIFKIWGGSVHNPSAYFFKKVSFPIMNHIVIIVGWKDSSLIRTGGYWICKNSWGTDWGYDGFFNIAYGSLNIDNFYIISVDYDPDSYNWNPYVDTGGPYGGYPNQDVIFDGGNSIGFEGEIIDYIWDFGDQTTGSGKTTAHSYENTGIYTIKLTVTDNKGNNATKTTNLWIQETNEKPETPSIDGPNQAKVWKEYEFTFSSLDSDGNDLLYYIDWGDGKKEEWIGPYASGEEFSLEKVWVKTSNSVLRVKVKDPFGEESDWGTLSVNIPRSRISIGSLLLRLFKNFFSFFN